MDVPRKVSCSPPGLQYLATVDQLLIHQQVELVEVLTGFETANKYAIKNTLGQPVYWAAEGSGCCARICCGSSRSFDMKLFDNFRNEILHLSRPFRCESCCFPCCLQAIEVATPQGTPIGIVEQGWSLLRSWFRIRNAAGDTVLTINAPFCKSNCFGDVKFKISSSKGFEVGAILKQWSGLVREMYTSADHYSVVFPQNVNVEVKAIILAAVFLIDYMFFEKSGGVGDVAIGCCAALENCVN
ncbi:phospholipid scramblase 1-like [Ochlerotatus camptorhynchus]|uniref:phospholipid scramblase 1-like n=1 Tax=Ochlerotatus camptorhynchus TaxID=644619 RepID=UPI0031E30817